MLRVLYRFSCHLKGVSNLYDPVWFECNKREQEQQQPRMDCCIGEKCPVQNSDGNSATPRIPPLDGCATATCSILLIEFVANYKTKKDNCIEPSTLKCYIVGIQRAMSLECGYDLMLLQGPVLTCPRKGLLNFVDNNIREQ